MLLLSFFKVEIIHVDLIYALAGLFCMGLLCQALFFITVSSGTTVSGEHLDRESSNGD
jgi:hypothetical protein